MNDRLRSRQARQTVLRGLMLLLALAAGACAPGPTSQPAPAAPTDAGQIVVPGPVATAAQAMPTATTPLAQFEEPPKGPATAMPTAVTTGPGRARVALTIPTITGPGCYGRIRASAGRVPGVSTVEFEGQRAIVTCDPSRTTPGEIARATEASRVDTVSTIEPLAGQEQR